MSGQGSLTYSSPSGSGSGGGITVDGADNGLSVAGGYIVFGQNVGESGSPAELLSIREIPINGFGINYLTGGDGFMQIDSAQQSQSFYRGNTGLQPITIFTKQGLNPAPGSTYGNFQIGWLEESYENPDGQNDAVMSIGYNTDGADGSLNPDEASFATVLESHYQQGGIGDPDFEWYLQTESRTGIKNRHLFLVVDKINGEAVMDCAFESFNLTTTAGSPDPTYTYFNVSSSGQAELSGSSASFYVGNKVPATDGSFKITPLVGLNGVTRFEIGNTTTGHLQMLAGIEATGSAFINGYSNFWFQSTAPAAFTRGFIFINPNFDNGAGIFEIFNDGFAKFYGNVRFGTGATNNAATAQVHPSPGTAAANNGQLKLAIDSALKTTPEDGLFEYDGTNLYFTVGSTRKTVTLI